MLGMSSIVSPDHFADPSPAQASSTTRTTRTPTSRRLVQIRDHPNPMYVVLKHCHLSKIERKSHRPFSHCLSLWTQQRLSMFMMMRAAQHSSPLLVPRISRSDSMLMDRCMVRLLD